jgi:hypothetical protein
MDRMGLFAGGPQRFASTSQMAMIGFGFGGLQAAGLVSTPALGFPALKEGREDLIEVVAINEG